MLLAALFTRYPASKPVIAAWLLLVGVISIAKLGSRTEMVLLILSAAMMYHTVIRPIAPRLVIVFAMLGLLGFVASGAARNGAGGRADAGLNPFAYASEFENLFTNAFHLDRVRSTIGQLPAAFYAADFAALLPQQLAPFTKIDRADWYVNRFFPDYARAGGGLAFGTISEAVLTGGWLSALAAGAALGFCFAKIHRVYVSHSDRFWMFVLYVWVTTLSYQSFRNSTFALLVLFAYRFVPALVLVSVLAMALRPAALRARRAHAHGAVEA
jgi:oligosaccharide repeat unit polymerase